MTTYWVKVVQLVPESKWIQIEADSVEEALDKAPCDPDFLDGDNFEFDSDRGITERWAEEVQDYQPEDA